MLGMTQGQLQQAIRFEVSGAMTAYPEYRNLRQIIDGIMEGVAGAIVKNNTEIERQLRSAGVKI